MVEGTWGGLWDASLCGVQLLGALAVRLTAVGGLLALSVRLVQESGRRQSVRARGINRRWCWLLSLFLICCYWMGTVAATPARPTHDVAPVVDDRPCKGATDSAPVISFNGALCYWNAGLFRALERQAQVLNYLDKHKPLVMLVAEARVEATFRTPPCPDYIGLTRPHNSAAAGGMVLYHAAALSLTVLEQYAYKSPTCSSQLVAVQCALPVRAEDSIIVFVYRNPDATPSVWEDMQRLIERAAGSVSGRTPLFVVGDLNARAKAWGDSVDTGKKIADALDDLDLTLINTQYAYGSPTFRDISVLDVAMTNDLSLVSDLVIGDELVRRTQTD